MGAGSSCDTEILSPFSKAIVKETLRQFRTQTPECNFVIAPDAKNIHTDPDTKFEIMYENHQHALAARIIDNIDIVIDSLAVQEIALVAATEIDVASEPESVAMTILEPDEMAESGADVMADTPTIRVHEYLAYEFSEYAHDICKYNQPAGIHRLPFSLKTIHNLAEFLYDATLQLTPGSFHELISALDFLRIKDGFHRLAFVLSDIINNGDQDVLSRAEFIMLCMFSDDFPEYVPVRNAYVQMIEMFVNGNTILADALMSSAPTLRSYKLIRAAVYKRKGTTTSVVYHDIVWLIMTQIDDIAILKLLRKYYASTKDIKILDEKLCKLADAACGIDLKPYESRIRSIKKNLIGFARWCNYQFTMHSGRVRGMGRVSSIAAQKCKELFGEPPVLEDSCPAKIMYHSYFGNHVGSHGGMGGIYNSGPYNADFDGDDFDSVHLAPLTSPAARAATALTTAAPSIMTFNYSMNPDPSTYMRFQG